MSIDNNVLQNANIKAFLAAIRHAEGTNGTDGYRIMFGNRLFDSFDDHPQQYFTYRNLAGKTLRTSAAGAYQIVYSTWFRLKNKLLLPDFSPHSQDIAAIELITEEDALQDIIAGRFAIAVAKVNKIWASLPGANANQPEHPLVQVEDWYIKAGGKIAA
ncbi:MAG: glycoside hydrolase family 24 protein [Flavipsychrobacter sp.]